MTEISYDLPLIRVAGSASAMGEAYGRQCAEAVRSFVEQRLRAAKVYLWERGSRDLEGFLQLGAQCYQVFCDWDPEAALEHEALALASGVSPEDLYTTTNMTDIRDILLVQLAKSSSSTADAEGCTSVLVGAQRSADGGLLAAQTWDLNPQDVDDIIAIHRRPDAGPATWSVTCNGCPTLMGMNEDGLSVGTTNIKTDDARIGVGYLSLLHRAIRAPSREAAAQLIMDAPRAAAHTYWLADGTGACLLTTSATQVQREDLSADGILGQTNHLRHELPGIGSLEEPTSSTCTRLATVEHWASFVGGVDVDCLRRLFAERSHAADSINRYPEDGTGSATDACLVCSPSQVRAWACRGPADRGLWYQLDPRSGDASPQP